MLKNKLLRQCGINSAIVSSAKIVYCNIPYPCNSEYTQYIACLDLLVCLADATYGYRPEFQDDPIVNELTRVLKRAGIEEAEE